MTLNVFIREMFQQFPRQVIRNLLLLVLVNVLSVASIFTMAPVVDFLVDPDLENASTLTLRIVELLKSANVPVTLLSLLALMLGFQILRSGCFIVAMYSILVTKYEVLRELMVGVFRDFLRARWLFFSSSTQGTLLNTFNREMLVCGDAFGHMGVFFANCLQVLFYVSVPFYISWQVTAISLIFALFFAFPLLILGKVKYRLGQLNTSTANDMSAVLNETLGAAKVVLGFGNQKKSLTKYSAAYESHRLATLKAQTMDIATPAGYEPLSLLVVAIALLASQSFGVSLSETVVLLWALRSSMPLLGRLAAQRNGLVGFFPSYEQVKGLRDRARELEQESGSDVFGGFNREIRMKDIVFAYPDMEPALKDVDISIPKGSMVAIVGPSGAGKSTLIDVLMGFNTPTSGSVMFDDCPLNRYDITSYRRRTGYVPQDVVLFNASIIENLLWSKEDATEEAIKRACEQANVDEFVKDLPEGYETVVGDRGVRLSGGQAQRFALARAILREPELLILDEATSSLDTQSERLIQEAIEEIAKQTTVVVIAHRLSTIVNASYVYVLVGGGVAEEGTYTELIEKGGVFAQMNQLQILETTG